MLAGQYWTNWVKWSQFRVDGLQIYKLKSLDGLMFASESEYSPLFSTTCQANTNLVFKEKTVLF